MLQTRLLVSCRRVRPMRIKLHSAEMKTHSSRARPVQQHLDEAVVSTTKSFSFCAELALQ